MEIERCNDCRWWVVIEGLVSRKDELIGDCRVRSPVLVANEVGKRHACHPRVAEGHFCGKFKARHAPLVEDQTDA